MELQRDTAFDPQEAWSRLRVELDSMPIAKVAADLGLRRVIRHGTESLAQCPRHECREPLPNFDGAEWDCPSCQSGGRGASLLAAHVAGWRSSDEEPEIVAADFGRLAAKAFEIVDTLKWGAFFVAIPGWPADVGLQRGIYGGEVRLAKARELVATLKRGGMDGTSITRLLWAWSCAYCMPTLTRGELAMVFLGRPS